MTVLVIMLCTKMRKPIDLNRVSTLVRRYNTCTYDCDRYLYQIGRAVGELTEKDLSQIYGGELTSLMRSKILSWLRRNTKRLVLMKPIFLSMNQSLDK